MPPNDHAPTTTILPNFQSMLKIPFRAAVQLDVVLLLCSLGTRTLDHAREITNWQDEWEVDRDEQDGEDEVPSRHTGNEGQCTASLGIWSATVCMWFEFIEKNAHDLKSRRECCSLSNIRRISAAVCICVLPESTSEETEGDDKGEEDNEEDQVRSERANEVDEAEQAHKDQEEC